MSPSEFLAAPQSAPALNIPPSPNTVEIRVIDPTVRVTGRLDLFAEPTIQKGTKLYGPSYVFLISHAASKTHYLFDLGVRKDPENFSPAIKQMLKMGVLHVKVEKGVDEILDEASFHVKSKDITGIIWSHHHFDHIGDPSKFPPTTDLIVGPGFKAEYLPAHPTNPAGQIQESDFAGRTFREVDIEAEGGGLKIGKCPAMDFFGDGSMYLLSTPGHTAGHICALARVTTGPDTFILMGGDACHHGGEFRPTAYLPLPATIQPSPFACYARGCPGAALLEIHPQHSPSQPFYRPKKGFSFDDAQARVTVGHMQEFDAAPDVLFILAHDMDLLDELEYFPKTFNHWRSTAIKEKTRWNWLAHLTQTVEAKKKAAASSL